VTDSATVTEFAATPTRSLSGRWVVVWMFALGIVATAVIFIYWELHTRPFRPLTEAIGREYRHSLPKVEGGRHKGSANTLRIAMRVPFVPLESTVETQQQVNRVVELARQHARVADFEVLEVHLIQLAPEQAAVQRSFSYPTAQVLTNLPFAVDRE
jgi:hypothetical protein